jgi:hypothetical protein
VPWAVAQDVAQEPPLAVALEQPLVSGFQWGRRAAWAVVKDAVEGALRLVWVSDLVRRKPTAWIAPPPARP